MVPIPKLEGEDVRKAVCRYNMECNEAMEHPQGLALTRKQFAHSHVPRVCEDTYNMHGWHYLYGVPMRVKGLFLKSEAAMKWVEENL